MMSMMPLPIDKLSVQFADDDQDEADAWSGLDLSGKTLSSLGQGLFRMTYITHLYIAQNDLEFLPAAIAGLVNLRVLDASYNKLRALPPEMHKLKELRELKLDGNLLPKLPFELGRLYQLQQLSLGGNPLTEPIRSYAAEGTDTLLSHLLDNAPSKSSARAIPPLVALTPPQRNWIFPATMPQDMGELPKDTVTSFCYNILCEKYATRQVYRYCPSWALEWNYRKQQILKDILQYSSDIICLQEVASGQFYSYFQHKLRERDYQGLYHPKSRVRTMSDADRQTVDGCAIFFHVSKFKLVKEHCIEFERSATRYASGCADMLNRVMIKDNIALCALLERQSTGEKFFVCNLHLTWDPKFRDVKVIQTVLALREIENFLKEHNCPNIPVMIMGDFNSMHDSGVYELMENGKYCVQPLMGEDWGYDYSKFIESVGLHHNLKLRSAYGNELPYSNYTPTFVGIIDYIWYSAERLIPSALLGPVEEAYIQEHVDGCPNPHFASDHLALSAEFRINKSGE
ncbi:uncharacterized protein MONBRDRAFT_32477 [Monosiga brevicollis MX1]|uniref:poly(A)-specific ribonuclease n=1 Tax=Monosiga brevicollis TaxID=81824 RepID=A9UZR6_MONBE|nr:uncharacterized protein MONBRDRAFT_32477 [Monosiga brevicollis MX1]EDQ89277.1 predicted protein [Monosiga brevicollis MX1]|eukprot:XP_001745853.1 hypothetical protein [Monosiga brevicollis MX1]